LLFFRKATTAETSNTKKISGFLSNSKNQYQGRSTTVPNAVWQ
jgi:hypothetical protein